VVITLRKPSIDVRRRILATESTRDLTYTAVGATSDEASIPIGYAVDRTRIELGRGQVVFDRAKTAFAGWRQFHLGWVEALPDDTPIRVGETVLVIARAAGVWWTNATRIVYVVDEDSPATSRFGFAYGTLPDHGKAAKSAF